MKKLLLSLSAVALGAAGLCAAPTDFSSVLIQGSGIAKAPASRAEGDEDNSIEFSLAGDPADNVYSLNGVGRRSIVYLAAEFVPENCQMYAGAKITAISFYSALNNQTKKNDINEVEIFIIPEPSGTTYEPIVSKVGTVGSQANTYTTIAFDEPYTIQADQSFAFGYKFAVASSNDYYIHTDGVPTNDLEGGWYATGASGSMKWNNLADQIGNICITATITGENLPKDGVSVPVVIVPANVEPNTEFAANVTVKGVASNKVESVEIEYTIADGDPVSAEYVLSEAIGFGQTAVITIDGLSYDTEKADVHATFAVTKVNGNDNTCDTAPYTAVFNCFDFSKGFARMHLVEEGTGTWCGWCPRGIVMMEYLAENYPDIFARIALHNGDTMANTGSNAVLDYLGIPGFPFMFIDRTIGDDPGYLEYFDQIAANNIPVILGLSDLSGNIDAEGNLSVTSKVRFTFDTDNANDRYRMSYYVTEDGVGPYKQSNYYAGGGYGKMGGWENKASSASTIYNEVMRTLVGDVAGISGSIPAEIEGGKDYEYTTTVTYGKPTINPYYLTGFIIDNTTGEVVNAKQVLITRDSSGLTDAFAAKLTVSGAKGAVEFSGDYSRAEIYNVAGQLLAAAKGESEVAVPAGLYIVKADGVVAKVIVK